jgi:CRISPR system Cascade subunit CasC
MIVELHLLQNFAPSCLNRDDTNSPKDCEFGGFRRARISSQCIKRAIRWHPSFRRELEAVFALRSSQHAWKVAARLAAEGKPKDEAVQVCRYMFQRMGFKEKNQRLTVMLLLGDDEISKLARAAGENWEVLAPLASVNLLWERLAGKLAALVAAERSDDAEILGRLLANQKAATANATALQALIDAGDAEWAPVVAAVLAISPEVLAMLRQEFTAEIGEPGPDGEDTEEHVPKKAAMAFRKLKPVADALKAVAQKKVKDDGAKDAANLAKAEATRRLNQIFKPLKKLSTKAIDVAMFGRMIAEIRSGDMNVDASCQVAHAISTNKVSMEMDYFTAVEELKDVMRSQGIDQDAGAGMIGTVEFNSSCFYRYANVDLGQLVLNLKGDHDLARETVAAFILASVEAIPTGKQNSMAAQNPPDLVLAVVRKTGAWSLANAFVRPVRPDGDGGLVDQSVASLGAYWAGLAKMLGGSTILATPYCTTVKGDIAAFPDSRVDAVDQLIESVVETISQEAK